jgi:hypothetical protein
VLIVRRWLRVSSRLDDTDATRRCLSCGPFLDDREHVMLTVCSRLCVPAHVDVCRSP